MHTLIRLALTAPLFLTTGLAMSAPAPWSEVTAQPQPPAGERIAYGPGKDQFAELFLPPQADGPVPVLALIHGGCWLQQFDVEHLRPLAAAITELGWAVWLPEYRRVGGDDAEGGYPQTFLDIATAMDLLRQLAPQRNLDLGRLAVSGHSAGGHLALWSATRGSLPMGHALHRENPLLPKRVIGLAAIGNLQTYRVGPAGSCHSAVDVLMGGTPDEHPQRYAAASPAQRLPLSVPAVLIQGVDDPIVSMDSTVALAKQSPEFSLVRLPGLGHFDVIIPRGAPWIALRSELAKAAKAED